jgi:hypothetical protein
MRRGCRALACAVVATVALCAPAFGATTNGQLAAVADGRLVTLNPDGSGLRELVVADVDRITELAFAPRGNRLAFIRGGELAVIDLAGGPARTLALDAANPAWSADGMTIAFRRGAAVYRVPVAGGSADLLSALPDGTSAVAWRADGRQFTPVVDGLLALAGLDQPPAVTGLPAWSPDDRAVAYPRAGGLSVMTPPGAARPVIEGAAGPPRWSPDGSSLVYSSGGEVRTVALANGAVAAPLTGAARVGPVDWQPCVEGATASCASVSPPQCGALTANATTQAEQPIDLPAPPCTDPASRPLALILSKPPDHGSVSGLRYTPAPGFSGQDTVAYRVSNGVYEIDAYRVTIFVVPRPAAPVLGTRGPVLVQGAPFLSATAVPRLDRRRRAVIKVTCDQDCAMSVRLSARLRTRTAFHGPRVRRAIRAKQLVRLRLRLPAKPRGRIKTVWVTGTVRNAAGDERRVRLPVRVRR